MIWRLGEVDIDPEAREIRGPLDMTDTAFSVLMVLHKAKGRVRSRQVIFDRAIGDSRPLRTVDKAVSELRSMLEDDPSEPKHILTVRGAGYQLTGLMQQSPATLCFAVSPDDEHIQLTLVSGGARTRCPSRAFDYMLLLLARARLADAADAPTDRKDHGWMDTSELAYALELTRQHLNVDVFRARRSFQAMGMADSQAIIETKAGLVRLGVSEIRIGR